jgi:hypothetical protein
MKTSDRGKKEWQCERAKPVRGRKACDLETPDVDKLASKARLKFGEIFSETTGFLIAMLDQAIGHNNHTQRILKHPKTTNCIC